MKRISIVVPCYNEEENIVQMGEELVKRMNDYHDKYDYEIICMENCSSDNTRKLLREMCENNKKIKAILNAKNFGQFNSPYYGLLQASGDCAILVCCDGTD